MNSHAKKLLFDALESGRSIRQWSTGRSFAEYQNDRQLRRAVEREFEIIDEALNRSACTDPDAANRLYD